MKRHATTAPVADEEAQLDRRAAGQRRRQEAARKYHNEDMGKQFRVALVQSGEGRKFTKENQPKGRGRKKGSLNKLPKFVKDALIMAVEMYGANGKGEGGLTGYMYRVCDTRPDVIMHMLSRVMPLQKEEPPPKQQYKNIEEFDAALKARGLPTLTHMFELKFHKQPNPYDAPEEQPEYLDLQAGKKT